MTVEGSICQSTSDAEEEFGFSKSFFKLKMLLSPDLLEPKVEKEVVNEKVHEYVLCIFLGLRRNW